MTHEMMNLAAAAEHIHVSPMDLKHAAQRGEIKSQKRGDEWYFDHVDLDEWSQRNLLAATEKEQLRRHKSMVQKNAREKKGEWRITDYLSVKTIFLSLPGKTKAGIVRDMADLAKKTGFVYDPDGLYKELMDREEVASTAVGHGAAFLHPKYHDPYLFEEPFVIYARSQRPVYFGGPDDEPTQHFFLIAATDHDLHLQILARLAVMSHATEFLDILNNAMTSEDAHAIIKAAEEGLLRTL